MGDNKWTAKCYRRREKKNKREWGGRIESEIRLTLSVIALLVHINTPIESQSVKTNMQRQQSGNCLIFCEWRLLLCNNPHTGWVMLHSQGIGGKQQTANIVRTVKHRWGWDKRSTRSKLKYLNDLGFTTGCDVVSVCGDIERENKDMYCICVAMLITLNLCDALEASRGSRLAVVSFHWTASSCFFISVQQTFQPSAVSLIPCECSFSLQINAAKSVNEWTFVCWLQIKMADMAFMSLIFQTCMKESALQCRWCICIGYSMRVFYYSRFWAGMDLRGTCHPVWQLGRWFCLFVCLWAPVRGNTEYMCSFHFICW